MMRRLALFVLEDVLPWLAGGILFVMMIMTCADVIGRYFFAAPLTAAYEATGIGVALLLYAALPFVTMREEHVTITMLDRYIPERSKTVQRALVRLITFGVLCLLTWALWRTANGLASAGVRTDSFRLPVAPVTYFMAVTSGITAMAVAYLLVSDAAGSRRASDEPKKGQP